MAKEVKVHTEDRQFTLTRTEQVTQIKDGQEIDLNDGNLLLRMYGHTLKSRQEYIKDPANFDTQEYWNTFLEKRKYLPLAQASNSGTRQSAESGNMKKELDASKEEIERLSKEVAELRSELQGHFANLSTQISENTEMLRQVLEVAAKQIAKDGETSSVTKPAPEHNNAQQSQPASEPERQIRQTPQRPAEQVAEEPAPAETTGQTRPNGGETATRPRDGRPGEQSNGTTDTQTQDATGPETREEERSRLQARLAEINREEEAAQQGQPVNVVVPPGPRPSFLDRIRGRQRARRPNTRPAGYDPNDGRPYYIGAGNQRIYEEEVIEEGGRRERSGLLLGAVALVAATGLALGIYNAIEKEDNDRDDGEIAAHRTIINSNNEIKEKIDSLGVIIVRPDGGHGRRHSAEPGARNHGNRFGFSRRLEPGSHTDFYDQSKQYGVTGVELPPNLHLKGQPGNERLVDNRGADVLKQPLKWDSQGKLSRTTMNAIRAVRAKLNSVKQKYDVWTGGLGKRLKTIVQNRSRVQ